jgi:hypothetical protein
METDLSNRHLAGKHPEAHAADGPSVLDQGQSLVLRVENESGSGRRKLDTLVSASKTDKTMFVTRVARFTFVQHTKTGKIYTKRP